ncbi:MAG: NAD-dependent epimerase/dehydratase family protein [Myxococcota bacterium]
MGQRSEARQPLDVVLPLHLAEPEAGDVRPTADLGHCLVTGAAGYLGQHLVRELLRCGARVRGFDRAPLDLRHPQLESVTGDVRDYEQVRKACEGIDTVFHIAAVLDFARFATREQRERSYAVNVRGVEHVVRAAREAGAARLVHTSSNNVTFDAPVIDGDETRPYATHARDLYTETKALGEQVALAANGHGGLLTCAIRPGGIYGPGETLVFPRVIDECVGGRYVAKIGDGSALSDNTFIENLVDAEIEAARHLLPGSPLAGQAYFVTDGAPINYFEFFRPVVEALGFRHPTRSVPGGLVMAIMTVWEGLHFLLGSLGLPRPPLLALEVKKIAVSHYNRIDKAERDFGWRPRVSASEAIRRMIEPCRRLLGQRETVERPHWGWWVAILGGMGTLGVLALSPTAHAAWEGWVGPWTPRPLLLAIFAWAVGLHVWKGLRAAQLAEQLGLHRTAMTWGWQTFALGFASLRLLERRARTRDEAESV